MIKKILGVSAIIISLVIAVPVLAQDNANIQPATADTTATKIACVGAAIAAREMALATAVAIHTEAIAAAYATRANELAGAYSNNTAKEVQAGVKVSWNDFKKSTKSAANKWKADRDAAWSIFKKAVKACKAPAGVSDAANSLSEVKGQ